MFRMLIYERHSEPASFARFEGMHLAPHVLRWKPRAYGVSVNEGLIDRLTRCLDNPYNPGARSLGGWRFHVSSPSLPVHRFARRLTPSLLRPVHVTWEAQCRSSRNIYCLSAFRCQVCSCFAR